MSDNLVWKMNVGPSSHIDTTNTPYHAGYGYLTTDEPSGGFYIDANDKRYHINEVDATLSKSGVAADAAAVKTRFDNILGGSREKHNEVLLATGWATPSGQDYAARYDITTLNARYATGEWQMEVNVDSLTGAQRAALMDAEIMNGQSSQYLYAYGVKPGVDIPVVMTAYTEGTTAPTSNYIRVTVVGSTDFANDWLALEGESEALTPEQGLIYLIIDEDYEGSRGVYWDDAADAYIPIATGGGATKTHLPVPVVSAAHPTYNPTTPITLASLLSGYDPTIMSLEGVTTTDDGEGGIIDAGTYTAYVKIKLDVVNLYDWAIENSQTGEIEYVATRQELSWTVDKASLTAPTINGTNTFTYDTTEQGPSFNDVNDDLMNKTNTKGTIVNNYTATFSLKDTTNYQWTGGSIADVTLNWSITKALLTPPSVSNTSKTYNKNTQGPTIGSYDSTKISIKNNGTDVATAINVGNYRVVFQLVDSDNYDWTSGATTTVSWSIAQQTVNVPNVTNTSKNYSGSSQGPTIATYDTTVINVANSGVNVTTATNAGTYHVVFSLADTTNYKWATGAVTTIDWTINKVAPTLSVSPTSWAPTSKNATQQVTITTNSDGTLSATSNNTSYVTVGSISSKKFTMTSVGAGSTTVTVNVAAGTNWTASSTTVSYAGSWIDLTGKTFANVTDTQLTEIVNAYYSGALSANTLKSTSGWEIGSTRTISITGQSKNWDTTSPKCTSYTTDNTDFSTQNVVLEIIDYEHDDLVTTTGSANRTKALMSIQQKDMIAGCEMYWTRDQGSTSDEQKYGTNSVGWTGSAVRRWCNGGASAPSGTTSRTGHTVDKFTHISTGYYAALPSTLRSLVKLVEKPNIKTRTNTSIDNYTQDYIWLPSEWEVFGSKSQSPGQEGTHYSTKYNSSTSRIKQKDGSNSYWWVRSVFSSNAYYACSVNSSGNASYVRCGRSDSGYGVAPAFCI